MIASSQITLHERAISQLLPLLLQLSQNAPAVLFCCASTTMQQEKVGDSKIIRGNSLMECTCRLKNPDQCSGAKHFISRQTRMCAVNFMLDQLRSVGSKGILSCKGHHDPSAKHMSQNYPFEVLAQALKGPLPAERQHLQRSRCSCVVLRVARATQLSLTVRCLWIFKYHRLYRIILFHIIFLFK